MPRRNAILYHSTTLTNAQILALPTTPIDVVPACGIAGYRVKLVGPVSLIGKFNGGAYSGVDPDYAALVLQVPNGDWATCPIVNDSGWSTGIDRVSSFLENAHQRVVDLPVPYFEGFTATPPATDWVLPGVDADYASWDNVALQLFMDNNGAGNLGGGHADNTLRVSCYYLYEELG